MCVRREEEVCVRRGRRCVLSFVNKGEEGVC